jgi:hypothetical protein
VAASLKSQYGPEIPARIADMITRVHAPFPKRAFLRDALAGYEALELMPRGRHIARALRTHLPQDVPAALDILIASIDPPRSTVLPLRVISPSKGVASKRAPRWTPPPRVRVSATTLSNTPMSRPPYTATPLASTGAITVLRRKITPAFGVVEWVSLTAEAAPAVVEAPVAATAPNAPDAPAAGRRRRAAA